MLILFPEYDSNLKVKEDEIGRLCSTHGETRGHKIFVGKPEGKRQLGISRRRYEDSIKMCVREIK
jgi:hypothetical protein